MENLDYPLRTKITTRAGKEAELEAERQGIRLSALVRKAIVSYLNKTRRWRENDTK